MKYFLGIDGGGTKTAYLLVDETGRELACERTTGCSYKEIGIENTVKLLKKGALQCIENAGITSGRLTGAAVGLPCFGELKEEDILLETAVRESLDFCPVRITNDVEVGWAGSLGLQPGINIVAGTGSIAFGKNAEGESARSGGWSSFFGDEGSCCWLGRRTMELFSKQADHRVDKGPLYDIVMEEFGLQDAMDFIKCMDRDYIADRSMVASLQKLLLQAADKGDRGAVRLYREAAEELAMMVESIAKSLWDGEEITVSYSGGLFHAKEYVLPVLEKMIGGMNARLEKPLFSPVRGAVLMAMEHHVDAAEVVKAWKE